MVETHRRYPDVVFGWLPGNCLYHDISGSVRHKMDIEPDDPDEFVKRYGEPVHIAVERIYAHSRSLMLDIV